MHVLIGDSGNFLALFEHIGLDLRQLLTHGAQAIAQAPTHIGNLVARLTGRELEQFLGIGSNFLQVGDELVGHVDVGGGLHSGFGHGHTPWGCWGC